MKKHLLRTLFVLWTAAALATAAPVTVNFSANLTPDQEIPPPDLTGGASPSGSASATLTYDDANLGAGGSLTGMLSWSGLTTPAIMAHIHAINNPANCRPDGLNCGTGPVLIPFFMAASLPTTDTFNFNLAITDVQLSALVNGLALAPPAAGALYFNIHTVQNPSGEIRGDIENGGGAVPEPGSMALLGMGVAALAVRFRKS